MYITLEHFRRRIGKITDTLLNRYLFWVLLPITAVPAAFRTDPLFYYLIPSIFTPFVHIVFAVCFSIITVKLDKKYLSDNKQRLYLVFLTILAAAVLNWTKMQFFDSLALYLLYFIFGLAFTKGVNIGIPLLLFIAVLARPVITVPLIPYAVYLLKNTAEFFPDKEKQKKIRETVISCIVLTAIALLSSFFLNRTDFIRTFVPNTDHILYALSDVSKLGIAVIAFSFFAARAYLNSKPLKRVLTVNVICTFVVFWSNYRINDILFAYLLIQSIVLWGILCQSSYSYVKDSSKSKCPVFMAIVLTIILGQLLLTFVFNDYDSSPGQFRITPFYICYQDFGFIQRGLFGTVFRFLFGESIPKDTFFSAYFISYVLLKILLFLLIVRIMHYAKSNEERTVAMLLVFAFLISPGFDKFYFETFGYVMAWASVLLAYKNRNTVFLIPVFCLLAMLTHQVFAGIIFPVVFIVLIYRVFIDSQGHTVRNTAVLTITLLVVCISFFYFTFFNARKIDMTYEQVCDIINGISGGFFIPHEILVKYVYLDGYGSHLEKFLEKNIDQLIHLLCVFLLSLPSVFLYVYAFVHSAGKTKSKKQKFGYIICVLSILAIVPAFVRESDFGRWCSQYVSMLVLAPLILTVFQTENNKWYRDMSKKRLSLIMALIFFTALIQPNFDTLLLSYEIKLF